MNALLDFSFEDAGARWFIQARSLQDVCRIDPVVDPAAHHTVRPDFEFVHRDLARLVTLAAHEKRESNRTLLYVAE